MKKRMKTAALMTGILIGIFVASFQVQAEEYVSLSSYQETFKPSGTKDGILTIQLEGEPDQEGYLYVISSVKDMEPFGEVSGQNLEGVNMEPVSVGSVGFYRIKAADKDSSAALTAQFLCPGFYSSKKVADVNGGEKIHLDH